MIAHDDRNPCAHAELHQQTAHAKTVFGHLKWELATSSNSVTLYCGIISNTMLKLLLVYIVT